MVLPILPGLEYILSQYRSEYGGTFLVAASHRRLSRAASRSGVRALRVQNGQGRRRGALPDFVAGLTIRVALLAKSQRRAYTTRSPASRVSNDVKRMPALEHNAAIVRISSLDPAVLPSSCSENRTCIPLSSGTRCTAMCIGAH